jgi:hypothetical protein
MAPPPRPALGAKEQRQKLAMLNSLRVIGLTGRLHAVGLTNRLNRVNSVDVSDAPSPPAKVPPAPSRKSSAGLSRAEALHTIRDAYCEVTGVALPADMNLEEAYAELRLRALAGWQRHVGYLAGASSETVTEGGASDGGGMAGDASPGSLSRVAASSGSSAGLCADGEPGPLLSTLREAVRTTMISLREVCAVGGSDALLSPADDAWDGEMLEMLNASYHELTGMTLPSHLRPSQAEMALRETALTAWIEAGYEGEGLWSELLREDNAEACRRSLAESAASEGGAPPSSPTAAADPSIECAADGSPPTMMKMGSRAVCAHSPTAPLPPDARPHPTATTRTRWTPRTPHRRRRPRQTAQPRAAR